MTGRDADLKIIFNSPLGLHKKINCLSVWNGVKKTFYDESEGLVQDLRSPFVAIQCSCRGE